MAGKRLCCLYIPDFHLQVQLLAEPHEASRRLVIVSPPRGKAGIARVRVLQFTEAARAVGIQAGMSLAEATLACAELEVRDLNPEQSQDAAVGLTAELCGRFPAVEPLGDGVWLVGTRGLGLMYPDEATILDAIGEAARRAGYQGRVAAASNRFTTRTLARALALGLTDRRQVPDGEEALCLGPLPLGLLPDAEDLLPRLAALGIHTMAAFAALDPRAVERRYGAAGVALHRLARGEDSDHLEVVRAPRAWEDRLDLDAPVQVAEGLLFLLAPLLEGLVEDLAREGRACGGLRITLELEGGKHAEVPLDLAAPTEQPRVLLDLLRLALGRLSLEGGIVAVVVRVSGATAPSHDQQHLFERKTSPTGMALTLARLRDTLGAEAVVLARPADGYLPGQRFVWEPTELLPGPPRSKPGASSPPLEVNPAPAFRWVDPARPIAVGTDDRGNPREVQLGAVRREVLHAFGPLLYDGGWWSTQPFGRHFYRLWLANDAEILVHHDLDSAGWLLDGIYD